MGLLLRQATVLLFLVIKKAMAFSMILFTGLILNGMDKHEYALVLGEACNLL